MGVVADMIPAIAVSRHYFFAFLVGPYLLIVAAKCASDWVIITVFNQQEYVLFSGAATIFVNVVASLCRGNPVVRFVSNSVVHAIENATNSFLQDFVKETDAGLVE